jgi:TonB family protein
MSRGRSLPACLGLALAAFSQPTPIPSDPPDFVGTVIRIEKGDSPDFLAEVLATGGRSVPPVGVSDVVIRLVAETRILSASGKVVGLEHLGPGRRIRVWFGPKALLSYPLQAVGRVLVLEAPPPPETPPGASGRPIRVSGGVMESRLVHRVSPVYPDEAQRRGVEGVVWLHVETDENGRVTQVKLIQGHPLLVDSSIEAVREWRYRPVEIDGRRVPAAFAVEVEFRLGS